MNTKRHGWFPHLTNKVFPRVHPPVQDDNMIILLRDGVSVLLGPPPPTEAKYVPAFSLSLAILIRSGRGERESEGGHSLNSGSFCWPGRVLQFPQSPPPPEFWHPASGWLMYIHLALEHLKMRCRLRNPGWVQNVEIHRTLLTRLQGLKRRKVHSQNTGSHLHRGMGKPSAATR